MLFTEKKTLEIFFLLGKLSGKKLIEIFRYSSFHHRTDRPIYSERNEKFPYFGKKSPGFFLFKILCFAFFFELMFLFLRRLIIH